MTNSLFSCGFDINLCQNKFIPKLGQQFASYFWYLFITQIWVLMLYFERLHVCYCYNKVKWIFLMLISCAYLSIYPMWRMIMSRLILELLVHTIPGKKSMPPWIHTKFEGGERGRVLKYVVKTCSKISPFLPFLGCIYDMYIKFVAKTELQIQINIFFFAKLLY